MLTFKRIWIWILLNNGDGLALLVTAWSIGAIYIFAGLVGLVENANPVLGVKFFGLTGLVLFVFMPLLNKLFKNH